MLPYSLVSVVGRLHLFTLSSDRQLNDSLWLPVTILILPWPRGMCSNACPQVTLPIIHLCHIIPLPASLVTDFCPACVRAPRASGGWQGYVKQLYLESARGKAGQVEAVEQLLVCYSTALCLHLVRTDNRSLPLKHKVTVTGPYQLRSSLWTRKT